MLISWSSGGDEGVDLRENRERAEKVCRPPNWSSGKCPVVEQGCLPEFKTGTQGGLGETQWGDALWHPQKALGEWGRKAWAGVLLQLWGRGGGWGILSAGEQREQRMSASNLPDLLEGVAYLAIPLLSICPKALHFILLQWHLLNRVQCWSIHNS